MTPTIVREAPQKRICPPIASRSGKNRRAAAVLMSATGARGGVVAVAEEPPANEPESYGPEILRADAPDGDLRPRLRLGFAADDGERVGEAGIERMIAGDGGRLDAGERGGALEQRGIERVLLLEVRPLPEVDRIARGRKLILGLQYARGLESRVHVLQSPEAADQQARARDEHDRERQLGDDQRAPKARAAGACRSARRTVGERRLEIEPARLERRNQPEHDADQHRDAERRRQDRRR